MNIEDILKAQEEAERFIASVQDMLEDRAHNNSKSSIVYGMYGATIKRRSMDLTRSLSKMRQGN